MKRKTVIKILIGIVAFILIKSFLYYTEVEYSYPVWSKDGKRIYCVKNINYYRFAQGGFFFEYRIYKNRSYVMSMNSDGSWKKVLAKFVGQEGSLKYVENLAILPDGKELIFYLLSNEHEESGIYKINIDVRNLVKVANFLVGGGLSTDFYLSPDGKNIAYTKCEFRRGGLSGQWYSSWLVGIGGQDNYMICGEESKVEGWTKDGKIIIDAYVDIEGNPKPRFDNKGQYEGDLKSRYLIYDPLSMKLIKEVPQEFKKINIMLKKDTTISPDGKKKIFWEEKNLGVMDMDGENKKILLKDKVRYLK